MPDGWTPNADAFVDGVQIGVYVALLTLLVLVVVTGIRRIVEA